MKVNENLRKAIFATIENQIKADDLAETALTLKRLLEQGCSEFQAKQFIGQALAVELFDIMKNKNPFNEARYVDNLRNLPAEPLEK
jgi:hypothetical protein